MGDPDHAARSLRILGPRGAQVPEDAGRGVADRRVAGRTGPLNTPSPMLEIVVVVSDQIGGAKDDVAVAPGERRARAGERAGGEAGGGAGGPGDDGTTGPARRRDRIHGSPLGCV